MRDLAPFWQSIARTTFSMRIRRGCSTAWLAIRPWSLKMWPVMEASWVKRGWLWWFRQHVWNWEGEAVGHRKIKTTSLFQKLEDASSRVQGKQENMDGVWDFYRLSHAIWQKNALSVKEGHDHCWQLPNTSWREGLQGCKACLPTPKHNQHLSADGPRRDPVTQGAVQEPCHAAPVKLCWLEDTAHSNGSGQNQTAAPSLG